MIRIRIRKKLNLSGGLKELVIDTELPPHAISALYGPSGAGKTSLLRMLAGLMQPEEGYIAFNGEVWLDTAKKISLPPQQRNIGFVFQDYALFPHITVRQNMQYAAGKDPDHALINRLLNATQLTGFADHKPAVLSGGQQQRAALARALVRKPDLLLLDEPLSAIDHQVRILLQDELLQLQRELNFTAILVSHDPDEISKLSASVLQIDNGVVIKSGSPAEVFGKPSHDNSLQLKGRIVGITAVTLSVMINRQIIQVPKPAGDWHINDEIELTALTLQAKPAIRHSDGYHPKS